MEVVPASVARDGRRALISRGSVTMVLGHQGGWDELALILVPLIVFLTLQWLNRRKLRKQEGAEPGTNSS